MVDEEVSFENAFETTLTATFGATDLTASVVTKGTLTSPTILVIEPDDDAQREYIRFNGVFGASSFVTQSVAFRYLVGSAAPSGLTHPSGAIVRAVATGQAYEDLHDRVDAHVTKAAHDALNIDADTLDGKDSLAFVEGTDHTKAQHDALGIESADALLLQGLNRAGYVEETEHDKAAHDALNIDADTLDGIDSLGFTPIAHEGGGGTVHADVVPAGADGFMTGTDKTKLDDLPAGTGFGGVPVAIIPDATGAGGAATTLSREDHTHAFNTAAPSNIGAANAEGGGGQMVRQNHVHQIADSRLVAVTAKHNFNGSPSGLGVTFASKASIAFAMPSGWTSCLVQAWGNSMYAGVAAGVQGNARILIDTHTGSQHLGGVADVNEDILLTASALFVTSEGTINIAFQDRHEGTSGTTPRYAWVHALLIRAS